MVKRQPSYPTVETAFRRKNEKDIIRWGRNFGPGWVPWRWSGGKSLFRLACENDMLSTLRTWDGDGLLDTNIVGTNHGGDHAIHVVAGNTFPWGAKLEDSTLGFLLSKGVSADRPNDIGMTPMFFAKHIDTLKFLRDKGADPVHTDNAGNTFLHFIARNIEPAENLKPILEMFPQVARIPNACGDTPLSNAFSARRLKCCDILVAHGGHACEAWSGSSRPKDVLMQIVNEYEERTATFNWLARNGFPFDDDTLDSKAKREISEKAIENGHLELFMKMNKISMDFSLSTAFAEKQWDYIKEYGSTASAELADTLIKTGYISANGWNKIGSSLLGANENAMKRVLLNPDVSDKFDEMCTGMWEDIVRDEHGGLLDERISFFLKETVRNGYSPDKCFITSLARKLELDTVSGRRNHHDAIVYGFDIIPRQMLETFANEFLTSMLTTFAADIPDDEAALFKSGDFQTGWEHQAENIFDALGTAGTASIAEKTIRRIMYRYNGHHQVRSLCEKSLLERRHGEHTSVHRKTA